MNIAFRCPSQLVVLCPEQWLLLHPTVSPFSVVSDTTSQAFLGFAAVRAE